MRSHLPPIEIGGFDHPHALTGISERLRPSWGDQRCETCSARGARNDLLHLDSLRCRIAICPDCEGAGWVTNDGTRHRHTIVMRDGEPAWTVEVTPAPTTLPEIATAHPECVNDIEPEYAEAA